MTKPTIAEREAALKELVEQTPLHRQMVGPSNARARYNDETVALLFKALFGDMVLPTYEARMAAGKLLHERYPGETAFEATRKMQGYAA